MQAIHPDILSHILTYFDNDDIKSAKYQISDKLCEHFAFCGYLNLLKLAYIYIYIF